MATISVVITAYNEEKNIEACLQSVKSIADELIIVDNTSTDHTAEIAKKYTENIYFKKNDPQNIDKQKNFGFSKATGDWILSLDADERVTKELEKEIKERLAFPLLLESEPIRAEPHGRRPRRRRPELGSSTLRLLGLEETKASGERLVSGYWIPRKNIIFGKWIEHTGWYPDYQLRLFQRGKGKYVGNHVHEDLVIDGKTAKLKEPLLHEHYQTVDQFILRSLTYIHNEAEHLFAQGYTFDYRDAIRFPFQEFLSRFFAREGYKDGLHGLLLSLLMAWYHFMIFAIFWEKKKFPDVGAALFPALEQETKKSYKELLYWFYNEKIKQVHSLTGKIWLKMKRKSVL